MKSRKWMDRIPSVLVAVGVIVSTAVSVATAEAGWLTLAGPGILALTMVGAWALGNRQPEASRAGLRLVLILAAAVLMASVIAALGDPAHVSTLMPILGAGAGFPLARSLQDAQRRAARCVPGRLR
jgi:uncharacterized membrane protein SirB2